MANQYAQAPPLTTQFQVPPVVPATRQRFVTVEEANLEWDKEEKKDKTASVACIAIGITLILIAILMIIFLIVWHLADTTLSAETKKKLDNVKIAMFVIFSVILLIGLIVAAIGFFIKPTTVTKVHSS